MKKHFLIIVCLFTTVLVSAQKPVVKSPDGSAKEGFSLFSKDNWMGRFQKRQDKMVQKLGLDDQQRRSLDTMNDAYVSQRAAFYDDAALGRHGRKVDIKQLQKDREAKFQNLLTPEQLKKWGELRKGQKKKVFRKK
jgi:Spy/CpxP family protein refolding chaperone